MEDQKLLYVKKNYYKIRITLDVKTLYINILNTQTKKRIMI